ncbi:hypothetical protein MXB_2634 [Myxobolus squamalis]|nr:hypothetical protein MXB_2634 [Myxobolus squamalis]
MDTSDSHAKLIEPEESNSSIPLPKSLNTIELGSIMSQSDPDCFSQYLADSQRHVIRIWGSTYCSGLIEHKLLKFLIMDQPVRANIQLFIDQLQKHQVHHVFRVCKPNYDPKELEELNIAVYDLPFDDGNYPDKATIIQWLTTIRDIFKDNEGCTIAVHCVAGLGRAPVMVAIALMESGMKYEEAVSHIRDCRRGAINTRQLEFLEKYKPTRFLKFKQPKRSCAII